MTKSLREVPVGSLNNSDLGRRVYEPDGTLIGRLSMIQHENGAAGKTRLLFHSSGLPVARSYSATDCVAFHHRKEDA